MKTIQLSVSSIILVSVLSGCSPQQLGSQQVGSSSAVNKLPAGVFYESKEYRLKRLGLFQYGTSQKQVEPAKSLVTSKNNIVKPKVQPKAKVRKVKKIVRKIPRPSHSVINTPRLPDAKPGQCFAKVKIPAKYITKTKRIRLQKTSSRRVLVRAAQYRWVNKRILVRKASYKTRVIPAKYKTIVRRKMLKPTHYIWKNGRGAVTRISKKTGRAIHRIKVPASYKNVKKRILLRPVQKIRTYVPAVYKTIKKKQRISSAIYKTVKKPSKYKVHKYRQKISSARYIWRPIACATNNLSKQSLKTNGNQVNRLNNKTTKLLQKKNILKKSVVRTNHKKKYKKSGINYKHYLKVINSKQAYYQVKDLSKPPRKVKRKKSHSTTYDMRTILKNKKLSKSEKKRNIIFKIQRSLKNKGFDPGVIDGKMGAWTSAALQSFQRVNGLPVGKLDSKTFSALGMIRSKQEG